MRFAHFIALCSLLTTGCVCVEPLEVAPTHPAHAAARDGLVLAPSSLLERHHPLPPPAQGVKLYEDDRHEGQAMDHGSQPMQSMNHQPTGQAHFTCTSHPHLRLERPGYCPICSMTLIRVTPAARGGGMDHGKH